MPDPQKTNKPKGVSRPKTTLLVGVRDEDDEVEPLPAAADPVYPANNPTIDFLRGMSHMGRTLLIDAELKRRQTATGGIRG